MQNWNSHTLLVEIQNGTASLENSWQFVIIKRIYHTTLQPHA